MAWARKPLPAKSLDQAGTLIGLDLNATRARAVAGPARILPRLLPLEETQEELPMVVSLEGRRPEVGQAGAALCRQSPHLACLDFLAYLGEKREWAAGRHRLDACKALALVLERLQPACADSQGVVLAIPAYLSRTQVALLAPLADKARVPLLGSVRAPLAAALTAYAAEPWGGTMLMVDADDHALTASTVVADGEQLWVHATQSWPSMNLRAWKGNILDRVADRCIRQSRRDPRDCPSAEQSLYEQLEEALDRCRRAKMIELLIQTTNWYQNLFLQPEDLVTFCERQVQQALETIQGMLGSAAGRSNLRGVLITSAVDRLPGLAASLQKQIADAVPVADAEPTEDFGEGLLQSAGSGPGRVTVLAADASARAAHELAGRLQRGELARGFLDLSVPVPNAEAPLGDSKGKRTFRLFGADPDGGSPSAG